MTRVVVSSPATDYVYLYDGGGERVAKFSSGDGAIRREFARIAIEARGDSPLSCTVDPFTDVPCATNLNDGKYVRKLKDVGITGGCGAGTTYCPDASTLRQEAAVFFLKAKWCPLNGSGCAYLPPACTPPPNQRFADVPCPSQYADWIEELADENITSGCGNGNFCPTTAVGTFNMLAWAAAIWPTYNPLPRDAVLTYRDQDAHVITEAHQALATTDTSQNEIVERDNVFLGSQLVAQGIWSGSTWTTLGYNFYASDHLGTPRLVTDINASQVALRKYWPYGDDGPGTGARGSFPRGGKGSDLPVQVLHFPELHRCRGRRRGGRLAGNLWLRGRSRNVPRGASGVRHRRMRLKLSVRRLFLYLVLALGGLILIGLLVALTAGYGEISGGWFGLVGFTPFVFYWVIRAFKTLRKRPAFWVALSALLVLHVLVFSVVLMHHPQLPMFWFAPISLLEILGFCVLLQWLLEKDTHSSVGS